MTPAVLVTYVAVFLADNWGWALLWWTAMSVVVVAAVCRMIHIGKVREKRAAEWIFEA